MNVKDIEAALVTAFESVTDARGVLLEALDKIREADHAMDLTKELEKGTELQDVRDFVEARKTKKTK